MKPSIYLLNWTTPLLNGFSGDPLALSESHIKPDVHAALAQLAIHSKIYLLAGAADINQAVLQSAYEGAGLARFISGYFCAADIQLQKGFPAFLLRVLMQLNAAPSQVTVIGEDYQQDILPGLLLGLKAIWLDHSEHPFPRARVEKIESLAELVEVAEEVIAQ